MPKPSNTSATAPNSASCASSEEPAAGGGIERGADAGPPSCSALSDRAAGTKRPGFDGEDAGMIGIGDMFRRRPGLNPVRLQVATQEKPACERPT